MYKTFKDSNNPLPRDKDLVDYGINVEEEEIFQATPVQVKDIRTPLNKKQDDNDVQMSEHN